MKQHVISKIVALFLLSLPLGIGGLAIEREEQWAVETLSHSELINHLNANRVTSPYEAMMMVFFIGLIYVGLVESCSYALRTVWQKVFNRNRQRMKTDGD